MKSLKVFFAAILILIAGGLTACAAKELNKGNDVVDKPATEAKPNEVAPTLPNNSDEVKTPAKTPDTVLPEVEAPEVGKPNENLPEIEEKPDTVLPEDKLPEVEAPEAGNPDTVLPEDKLPEVEAPEAGNPEGVLPEVEEKPDTVLPEDKLPEVEEKPDTVLPEEKLPEVEAPEVGNPEGGLPEVEEKPDTVLPDNKLPEVEAPEVGEPDVDSQDIIILKGVFDVKKEYLENEEFSNEGYIVVNVNGVDERINVSLDMVKEFNTSTPGTSTVSLEYKGILITYDIVVNKRVEIKILEIKGTTTEYFVDSIFDGKGSVVVEIDGVKKTIPLTSSMLEGFDTKTPGLKEIVVNYKGAKESYNIHVINHIVKITGLVGMPKEYKQGSSYKGGAILKVYYDGSMIEVNVTSNMITGFDTSSKGVRTITIHYMGDSIDFNINVI